MSAHLHDLPQLPDGAGLFLRHASGEPLLFLLQQTDGAATLTHSRQGSLSGDHTASGGPLILCAICLHFSPSFD